MELHPDRRQADNSDKDSKALEAARVTHAYDTLVNPLSRALHLLELNGSSIDEGDAVSHSSSTLLFYDVVVNPWYYSQLYPHQSSWKLWKYESESKTKRQMRS